MLNNKKEVKPASSSSKWLQQHLGLGATTLANIRIPLPGRLRRQTYEEGREWIAGLLLCAYGAAAILFLNVILTIIATAIGHSLYGGDLLSTDIYHGSCSVSSRWTTGIHALINILSTLLLAASNYSMQCLGAPSRADIDWAHQRHRWLDIGTFSVRNLSVLNKKQRTLWAILLLSSLPIHMLYNSVVFWSISALDYAILAAPDDLALNQSLASEDDNFSINFLDLVGASPAQVQAEIFDGTYKNVSGQECLDKYNTEFNTKLGTLVAITDRQYFHNTSIMMGQVSPEVPYSLSRTPFVHSSLYGYIKSSRKSTQQLVREGSFRINVLHFTYKPWKVTVPNPATASGSSSFDFSHGWKLDTGGLETPSGGDWNHDLERLYEYLILYSPDEEALKEYLSTPSHWANSSWAANVVFELGVNPVSINNLKHPISPPEVPISRCMVKSREQLCNLTFSPLIALVVIMSNLVKVICMFLAARTNREHLLLTVGDAISSFLTRSDQTTQDRQYLARAGVKWRAVSPWSGFGRSTSHRLHRDLETITSTTGLATSYLSYGEGTPAGARDYLFLPRKRWYRSISPIKWMIFLCFLLLCEGLAVSFFIAAFQSNSAGGTFRAAWALGFGKFTGANEISGLRVSDDLISRVLLANTPQLMLSILYFLANGILTSMLVAAEYNSYSIRRKPLRVSWPRDQQRSTYYLSLPYRYSIPLMLISAALHWLLSQSIFFVNVLAYDVHDRLVEGEAEKGCGYSPIPMFVTILMSCIALTILFGLSIRPFESRMPLIVQKSASISTACHPPSDDDEAASKPVMWGELPGDGRDQNLSEVVPFGATHLVIVHKRYTFTSKDVKTRPPA